MFGTKRMLFFWCFSSSFSAITPDLICIDETGLYFRLQYKVQFASKELPQSWTRCYYRFNQFKLTLRDWRRNPNYNHSSCDENSNVFYVAVRRSTFLISYSDFSKVKVWKLLFSLKYYKNPRPINITFLHRSSDNCFPFQNLLWSIWKARATDQSETGHSNPWTLWNVDRNWLCNRLQICLRCFTSHFISISF